MAIDFEIRTLGHWAETVPFAAFTFPAYRGVMVSAADTHVVAVGLLACGQPAGLALGTVSSQEPSEARLLSIMVAGPQRRRGAGRQLLRALEREIAVRGCRSITGTVTGSEDRSSEVEQLLAASGWRFDGPSSILCKAHKSIIETPWLANARLPRSMEVFAWSELTAVDRQDMLKRHENAPWIPENVSPFWNEPLIAGCSVGLRHRGQVIGWCVTYPFEGETLRWWRIHVDRPFQSMGRAIPLVAETIRRGERLGFQYGAWSVRADNHAMLRLLQRRMRPSLMSARPVWLISKEVEPGERV